MQTGELLRSPQLELQTVKMIGHKEAQKQRFFCAFCAILRLPICIPCCRRISGQTSGHFQLTSFIMKSLNFKTGTSARRVVCYNSAESKP
jgi:hypothetical protein